MRNNMTVDEYNKILSFLETLKASRELGQLKNFILDLRYGEHGEGDEFWVGETPFMIMNYLVVTDYE